MYQYCPECLDRLSRTGLAAEIYRMVCEYYAVIENPIVLFEPYFSEAIRYLELSEYIVSMESEMSGLIYIIPKYVTLDDHETIIMCAGKCAYTLIDFNPDGV